MVNFSTTKQGILSLLFPKKLRISGENPFVAICSLLLMGMYFFFLIPVFKNFTVYQIKMQGQVFDLETSEKMAYVVPSLLIIGFLVLAIPHIRFWGLIYSVGLMLIFSVYIVSVMLNLWDREACSCISAIKGITWEKQLYFNLSFMLVALLGAIVKRKERQ